MFVNGFPRRGIIVGAFLGLCLWATDCRAVSTMSINDTIGVDALSNLTAGNTDKILAKITINSLQSESPDGFTFGVSSLNSGKLLRVTVPSPLAYSATGYTGDEANYTFTMVSGSGTLGATEPTLPVAHELSTPISLSFETVTGDTTDKVYDFSFTVPAKSSLFSGTFGDTLTVTISDI